MKIAVILENPVEVGGGFNQAINAINQIIRITSGVHEVNVYTTLEENLPLLQNTGISAKFINAGRFEKLDNIDNKIRNIFNGTFKFFQTKNKKTITRFEKYLCGDGVDLVYFVTHSSRPNKFMILNFITTVLDLCHRDFPEFPEVRAMGEFEYRDNHFQLCLPKAIAVLVASESLSKNLTEKYGVNSNRMIAMPFEPAPLLSSNKNKQKDEVLKKYNLEEGYYFYPAQLWPHKNHIRILEAINHINTNFSELPKLQLVFSGGDGGAKDHLMHAIEMFGLSKQVKFLGFVPPDEIKALYEGCIAVVMPTYFGPTNLPPLEAWMLQKPLIYSRHLGNDFKDAALLVNVDNYLELADAILSAQNRCITKKLVENGREHFISHVNSIAIAEKKLLNLIEIFDKRRKCWA